MRIGILGGTFNPIHLGHLVLAQQVKDILGLYKVVFVPVFMPPHKEIIDEVSVEDRYKMVELAISGNENFDVSSMEIEAGGKSYTISTLEKFKSRYPQDELFFIAGSDSLREDWKDFSKILDLVKFVIVNRPNYSIDSNIDKRINIIDINPIDISSSQIRSLIERKKSVRYLLPDKVIQYIDKNSLYG